VENIDQVVKGGCYVRVMTVQQSAGDFESTAKHTLRGSQLAALTEKSRQAIQASSDGGMIIPEELLSQRQRFSLDQFSFLKVAFALEDDTKVVERSGDRRVFIAQKLSAHGQGISSD
jgi:hypothetical protein